MIKLVLIRPCSSEAALLLLTLMSARAKEVKMKKGLLMLLLLISSNWDRLDSVHQLLRLAFAFL
jgi:hypothetical protein